VAPAHKVYPWIGKTPAQAHRASLISRRAHDHYSIEDLAQIINDPEEREPAARSIVSWSPKVGVGTVAAGV